MGNRSSNHCALAAALCLLGGAGSALAQQQAPQKEIQRFKDWAARCEKSAEDQPERCFIFQDLVLKDKKQRVLLIRVAIPPDGEHPVAILTLPLGISLPPGVSIRVDKGKPVRVQVERCVRNGCIAGFPLNDSLLASFKAGVKAYVTVHDGRRKPATLPISLSGFTAALDSLR